MKARRKLQAHAIVLLLCAPASGQGAAASLKISDGICEYRLTFDAKHIDGAALAATFAYLDDATVTADITPDLSSPEGVAAADPGRCTAHRDILKQLRFIDFADLSALREKEVVDIDATCRRGAAALAVAKGDVAPARAFAPVCGRYADLLSLPQERLKAQWNDLVVDLCQTSTEPSICAGHLQRAGEGPGSEVRREFVVLQRWNECATAPSPALADGKRRIREKLMKQFKAKTLSCAQ